MDEITDELVEVAEKVATDILNNIVDLPQEYAEILYDNIWDLI